MVDRDYDIAAAERWREGMRLRLAGSKGIRGVRQAAEVVGFADGRAESPTESVARLQLARLGFERIGVQVSVPSPRGTPWWVDLELEEAGAFLEIDGAGKYEEEARENRGCSRPQTRLVRHPSPRVTAFSTSGRPDLAGVGASRRLRATEDRRSSPCAQAQEIEALHRRGPRR